MGDIGPKRVKRHHRDRGKKKVTIKGIEGTRIFQKGRGGENKGPSVIGGRGKWDVEVQANEFCAGL